MKKPIDLDVNHLGSFISAMLIESGRTQITLPFEKYKELGLGDKAIFAFGEFGSDKAYPISITLAMVDHETATPEQLEALMEGKH